MKPVKLLGVFKKYLRFLHSLLKSFWFLTPKIESLFAANEVVCDGHVTPIVLNLQGWGWLHVHVKGSSSKLSRVVRAILWPNWMTGFKEHDWRGFQTLILGEHSKVTVYAPCGELLKVRFINVLGFKTRLFKTPVPTDDIGHTVCPSPTFIRNSLPKVYMHSIQRLTSLKPVVHIESSLYMPTFDSVRIHRYKLSPEVAEIKCSLLNLDKKVGEGIDNGKC